MSLRVIHKGRFPAASFPGAPPLSGRLVGGAFGRRPVNGPHYYPPLLYFIPLGNCRASQTVQDATKEASVHVMIMPVPPVPPTSCTTS
jgi:hypothetical protein